MAVAVIVAACVVAASPPAASAGSRAKTQAKYLRLAEQGLVTARQLWWDGSKHWYRSNYNSDNIASLWQTVPLFEALSGVALADPSRHNKRALRRFAYGAERYLNYAVAPGGFGPHPVWDNPGSVVWVDDQGWWGLAFLDAYRVTGRQRFLRDAQIAQLFMSTAGWDHSPGSPGGLWWNTNQTFYAGESLAGGTYLSARLYALTHQQQYLTDALRFQAWGDQYLWNPDVGLYARLRTPAGQGIPPVTTQSASSQRAEQRALAQNPDQAAKLLAEPNGPARTSTRDTAPVPDFDPTPMPYVQGPMIVADETLCQATHKHYLCNKAETLAQRSFQQFGRFTMGPQFDAVYVRNMLELFSSDRNPAWYGIALRAASKAVKNSGNKKKGLWLRGWGGQPPSTITSSHGALQLDAATVSVFAWLAATR